MDQAEFLNEATLIASRNVNAAVTRIAVQFDETIKHLSVIYCFDRHVNDDDSDWCKLTCAELIAAFPEIKTAETTCCETTEGCKTKVANATVVYTPSN